MQKQLTAETPRTQRTRRALFSDRLQKRGVNERRARGLKPMFFRLIKVKWIAINLGIFFGALFRFLKFLFQQTAAIFMRTHLLRKDLLARLLLLVEIFDHLFERAERPGLFFMRKQRAGLGVDIQGRVAAGTDNSEPF